MRASDSFATIRMQVAPDLSWDSIRARVHWWVSKERNSNTDGTTPSRAPRLAWSMAAVATVAAIAALVPRSEQSPIPVAGRMAVPPTPMTADAAAPATAPVQLAGLVTRVAGASGGLMVDGERRDDVFESRLRAGTVLATKHGRVDVQFGIGSAFALGPASSVELRRFDADAIELVVDGTIDVEVAPRTARQRFVVIAGDRVIEVRGTQFQVTRTATSIEVVCRHGAVAVTDRTGAPPAMVSASRKIELVAGQSVERAQVVSASASELDQLARATPMTLPWIARWEDVDALVASSAALEIAADAPREVRVDGVELGQAPLRVRAMLGRHTVEAADRAGRFRRIGWVDVAAPSQPSSLSRVVVPEQSVAARSLGERPKQFRAGIDRARLRTCTRSIAKAGLTGTYVEIELSVAAQGAIGFLNVIDSDLPAATARCVRDVLADVQFGAGTAATWRERIDL
ncbi:MAG: FecR domain-containing protein [Kofleriaceae bacterium]